MFESRITWRCQQLVILCPRTLAQDSAGWRGQTMGRTYSLGLSSHWSSLEHDRTSVLEDSSPKKNMELQLITKAQGGGSSCYKICITFFSMISNTSRPSSVVLPVTGEPLTDNRTCPTTTYMEHLKKPIMEWSLKTVKNTRAYLYCICIKITDD